MRAASRLRRFLLILCVCAGEGIWLLRFDWFLLAIIEVGCFAFESCNRISHRLLTDVSIALGHEVHGGRTLADDRGNCRERRASFQHPGNGSVPKVVKTELDPNAPPDCLPRFLPTSHRLVRVLPVYCESGDTAVLLCRKDKMLRDAIWEETCPFDKYVNCTIVERDLS